MARLDPVDTFQLVDNHGEQRDKQDDDLFVKVQSANLSERSVRDEALRGSILDEGMITSANFLFDCPSSCAHKQVRAGDTQIIIFKNIMLIFSWYT
jgi:hypothetical protein